MIYPQNLIDRVKRGKSSASRLLLEKHLEGFKERTKRALKADELKLNRHNAKAERDYCAQLLRAWRAGCMTVSDVLTHTVPRLDRCPVQSTQSLLERAEV